MFPNCSLGVCRARPSQAKREFALHYSRWHISQKFVEGALRRNRSSDQCTHVGSTRSSVSTWPFCQGERADPGCSSLGCELCARSASDPKRSLTDRHSHIGIYGTYAKAL